MLSLDALQSLRARDGWSLVNVTNSNIPEAVHAVRTGSADGFFLSPAWNFSPAEVDHLIDVPILKALCVSSLPTLNMDAVLKKHQLEMLDIERSGLTLDLSEQLGLRSLSLALSDGPIGSSLPPFKNSKLERLILRNVPRSIRNLNDLPLYENLAELVMTRSHIKSLQGISRYSKISALSIHYASSLQSITEIESLLNLKSVLLDHCPRLSCIAKIGQVPAIREVLLENIPDIPSLEFLNEAKSLEAFIFMNTKVLDGDLTPLLRLRYKGFQNRRHYSHKWEELQPIEAHELELSLATT